MAGRVLYYLQESGRRRPACTNYMTDFDDVLTRIQRQLEQMKSSFHKKRELSTDKSSPDQFQQGKSKRSEPTPRSRKIDMADATGRRTP